LGGVARRGRDKGDAAAQDDLVPQDRLVWGPEAPDHASAMEAHATALSQAPGGQPGRLSAAWLALQERYGNQYAQRVAGLMREREAVVRRDLAREPPGRLAEPATLTEAQANEAIAYNTRRFSQTSIRLMQDIVGVEPTGVMDAETVRAIVAWQADFRLSEDGKIGLRTLRTIAQEMVAERMRSAVIRLIIDGHNLPTRGLTSIRYDASLTPDNAVTSGPIPGDSTVVVGPNAFAQGYEGLVHTIAHELEHVRQRREGIQRQPIREFLAEALEIMSAGMLAEGLAGLMDDAARMLRFWNLMTADEQRTHWGRFTQARNRVRQRFNNASAARRATHQGAMDNLNAVTEPAAGP